MDLFEFIFCIKPEGFFGLPEKDMIVFPAGVGDLSYPIIDTSTGNVVGHGSLPKYREKPLNLQLKVDVYDIEISDNYVFIRFSDTDQDEAIKKSLQLSKQLVQYLTIYMGNFFDIELVQGTINGERMKIPKRIALGSIRLYNQPQIQAELIQAMTVAHISNPIIEKATAYYSHGLFLFEKQLELDPQSNQSKFMTAETILNFNKSVTTIIGERGTDKDWETRYKTYNIQEELWNEIQNLRRLRNRYDIAHYSLGWDNLEHAKQNQLFAKQIAQKVLIKYLDWLSRNNT